jgi:hypothetical protein
MFANVLLTVEIVESSKIGFEQSAVIHSEIVGNTVEARTKAFERIANLIDLNKEIFRTDAIKYWSTTASKELPGYESFIATQEIAVLTFNKSANMEGQAYEVVCKFMPERYNSLQKIFRK